MSTQGSRVEDFAQPELKDVRRQQARLQKPTLLFLLEVLEASNGAPCGSINKAAAV